LSPRTALLLLAALYAQLSFAAPNVIYGRVTAIADGDTLTVLDANNEQHKIRLAEIDAPEKSQDFGQVSKQSLSDLAFGESAVATCNGQESFGRPVCKVVINGVNVNTEQVSRGMAWVYPKYASKFSVLYAYELKARSSRKGLWVDKNPTPPWEYRHARK
jgi:endonuclease YncB( thermonuclease family)